MALDLSFIKFVGPAFPEPFVKFDLEKELNSKKLLLKEHGPEADKNAEFWQFYRRKLYELGRSSGRIRVKNLVIDPLMELLGYSEIIESEKVATRENKNEGEDGGYLLKTSDGTTSLRVWTVQAGTDLDTPIKRGYAYRFSLSKIVQRVLLASNERIGVITDGYEFRIIIAEPSKNDSQLIINIDTEWKKSRDISDSFKLAAALLSPAGIKLLPELLDKARLKQSTITKELRIQARQAIDGFINDVFSDPKNYESLSKYTDKDKLARQLWHEGLAIVYKLLFVLKGEASDDPARSFNFTGSTLWRNTYSPTVALAHYVREAIDKGKETGSLLEGGLKAIFKMFRDGVKSSELNIKPLGGMLFDERSMPVLSVLHWPERACAKLLDKLLWTVPKGRGGEARQRIHYGSLDIEDLGRIYEALLELDAGISEEAMCRLRRAKLEVVVPSAQGEKYKIVKKVENVETEDITDDDADETDDTEAEEEKSNKKGKTKIEWIEEIPKDRFYLRVGLGRKATGSYYTPHSFVKFLVQETLGPKIDEVSPTANPYPNEILKIKVLDPAMGSAHFLVEACRFMGEKLYEACRLCDEKVSELKLKIEKNQDDEKTVQKLKEVMNQYRERIIEIPDPDDEILNYLPGSAPEEWRSGYSQSKALALCKRLVAVHCLYGIDKNPLAVELAKLSIWLESQSEGLPLTFLDHRFILGDSITGPFFEHLLKSPFTNEPLDDLFTDGLQKGLMDALKKALKEVNELEKSIGIDIADIENKKNSKQKMEEIMLPFKILAAAWTGGVMLGKIDGDALGYENLAKYIASHGKLPDDIDSQKLLKMIALGLGINEDNFKGSNTLNIHNILYNIKENKNIPSLPYDLTFPEVFFKVDEKGFTQKGFDVVLGNPPWDRPMPSEKEFFCNYNFNILSSLSKKERTSIIKELLSDPIIGKTYKSYMESITLQEKTVSNIYNNQNATINGQSTIGKSDLYIIFCEQFYNLLRPKGFIGIVIPSGFHANEGATGIRKLYLEKTSIKFCYSFENKRKLFEIHSSFKFALLSARKSLDGTKIFDCAFYIHDDNILFLKSNTLKYSKEFVYNSDEEYLAFLELRSLKDLEIAGKMFVGNKKFSETCEKYKIRLSRELNLTDNIGLLTRTDNIIDIGNDVRKPDCFKKIFNEGYLLVHEGKTFHQYTDTWESRPSYLIKFNNLHFNINWFNNSKFYRMANRKIASATNERTAIFSILPPGVTTLYSCSTQFNPQQTPFYIPLTLVAISNSFSFDWCSRKKVGSNFQDNIRNSLPVPEISNLYIKFFSRGTLRLSCNHSGYEPLWREQLGDVWRESGKKPFTWPVLETEEERWAVRSAIDAVVADAYGLDREQYEHILKSFDRASGPNPYTAICLEKFDELKKIGIDAYTKKYDPYHDIPLNENLPKPVIELPGIVNDGDQNGEAGSSDNVNGSGEVDMFGEPVEVTKSVKKKRKKA